MNPPLAPPLAAADQPASPTESTVAYLTPEQVAGMLQVSPKTVYRWASSDSTMPALRIGGVVRFPRERLLRWLQAREQGSGRARRPRTPSLHPVEPRATTADGAGAPAPCANP